MPNAGAAAAPTASASPFLPSAPPATSPAVAVSSGGGARRSGGDVALGLFSKIAAARKEKLSAIVSRPHPFLLLPLPCVLRPVGDAFVGRRERLTRR